MPLTAEYDREKIAFFRAGLTPALLTQCAATDKRPYIHPIVAPDGVGEMTENQPGHHLWQHGLYVGLNDVNGVGFWKEGYLDSKGTDGTFHPRPLSPPVIDGDRAQWTVVTEWRTSDNKPMLTETQKWSLHDRGDALALDLEWEMRAAIDLRFGTYPYGGLFLRMPWRKETGATILTSEDAVTTDAAEGQRARWIGLSMPLPGRAEGLAGMAMLDHPTNPEHPAPWRVDDNFGISPSRSILGEWHLAAGATTVSRYRVFVYTGDINSSAVETEWRHFATS